jgi:hypothetical protein
MLRHQDAFAYDVHLYLLQSILSLYFTNARSILTIYTVFYFGRLYLNERRDERDLNLYDLPSEYDTLSEALTIIHIKIARPEQTSL